MSSGFIRTLVGGFSELQTILYESTLPSASTSASSSDGATRSGVVLVQLSAKWCGPCRRIKPVVEELAAIHSDVDFVYIDAEETEENRELTQQLGVRGFPTFILYEAGNKKEEFSGADAARLTQLVKAHSSRTQAAPGGGPTNASSSDIKQRVHTALTALKAETENFDDFVSGASAICTFVTNVLQHPYDDKYKRVKCNGVTFVRRLGRFSAGNDLMRAVGFVKEGSGEEEAFVMKTVDPGLSAVMQFLRSALRGRPQQPGQAAAGGNGGAAGRNQNQQRPPPPQVSGALRSAIIAGARMSRDNPALVQELAPLCASMLKQALLSDSSIASDISTN